MPKRQNKDCHVHLRMTNAQRRKLEAIQARRNRMSMKEISLSDVIREAVDRLEEEG